MEEFVKIDQNGQWQLSKSDEYTWKYIGSDKFNHNYELHHKGKRVGLMHVERDANPGSKVTVGGSWHPKHDSAVARLASQIKQHALYAD